MLQVVCEGILSGSGRRTAASSELKARLLQLLGERANSGKVDDLAASMSLSSRIEPSDDPM